jgi:nucleoside phosphorylase
MRRLMRGDLGRAARFTCCGAGAAAVRRWAQTTHPGDRPVLLAGLAGSLRPSLPAGTAWIVSEICDPAGCRRRQGTLPEGIDLPTCRGVSTHRAVRDPAARHTLAASSGADLVDLESLAFAEIAADRGWRWAVVRAVSDGPDHLLPPGVDRWIGPGGRVRTARVLASLIRRPWTAADLAGLRRSSLLALDELARLLGRLLPVLEQQPVAARDKRSGGTPDTPSR